MLTTDEMRAKLEVARREARATGKGSIELGRADLAVIVKMDLEDALKALGASQRVMRTRVILVDAMRACDVLLADMEKAGSDA